MKHLDELQKEALKNLTVVVEDAIDDAEVEEDVAAQGHDYAE